MSSFMEVDIFNVSLLPPAHIFNDFENFSAFPLHDWVIQNSYISPLIAVTAYVVLVFVILPKLRVPAWDPVLKHLFAGWNLLLSVFSAIGVYYCLPFLMDLISRKGLRYLVCSDTMMLGKPTDDAVACYGPIGYMMSLFMLSKFPELLDTIFLVIMGKPVIFLHWYHHITVLLYSWFSYRNATPTAYFFGTMNYTVHAVMYFYFFASTYTRKLSFMRKPITLLQLTQMFFGVSATVIAYIYTADGLGCSKSYADGTFFLFCSMLYGSYFVLFAKLFVDNYLRKPKSKKAPLVAKRDEPKPSKRASTPKKSKGKRVD